MRNLTILFMLMFTLVLTVPSQAPQDSSCAVIQQALHDVGLLKIGMQRKELEKNFTLDGGATFRSPTTYVYKKCDYIKVDVEFDFDPAVDKEFSPSDKIIKISRLYIFYPIKD